jgi:hypothetical protein
VVHRSYKSWRQYTKYPQFCKFIGFMVYLSLPSYIQGGIMGTIFRSDEEREAVQRQASHHDVHAAAVLNATSNEGARDALHQWRMANWPLFRQIAISWRSRKLINRALKARGPAAFAA